MALANFGANTRILIKRCTFKGNDQAIYMHNSGTCHLQVDDSKFIYNKKSGIYGKCANVTVRLSNITFRSSPVNLSNCDAAQGFHRWEKRFEVFIDGSFFHGNVSCKQHSQKKDSLFRVKCVQATILNISVVNSTFADFKRNKKYKSPPAPISVEVTKNQQNVTTTIYFNKVTVNNIYTNQTSAVFLSLPLFRTESGAIITILNCVFSNNTRALKVFKTTSLRNFSRYMHVHIKNTTFDSNYNPGYVRGAAATLSGANYTINGCRFVNNYSRNRYLTGVVVLEDNARVTFERCLFENTHYHDADAKELQILSQGNTYVEFKTRNVFNLQTLRLDQSIIIHTSSYSHSACGNFGMVLLHGEIELKCPQGYRFSSYTNKPITKTKDFQHLEFNCDSCFHKMYSLERGGIYNKSLRKIECHDCPWGGVCRYGKLKATHDFWGYKNTINGEVSFVHCPIGYCCQDDEECKTYDTCHGNRHGTLCGKCKHGTSELLFGTECHPNEECESMSFWIGICITIASYCLFFLYYQDLVKYLTAMFTSTKLCSKASRQPQASSQSTKSPPRIMSGGFLKIIFYYYQIIHIFSSSLGERGKFYGMIRHFVTSTFNLVFANVFSIRCLFKHIQPIQKVAITHCLGFLLLMFVSLLFVVWKVIIAFKRSRLNSKPLYIDAIMHNKNQGTSVDFQDENNKTGKSFKCRLASALTHIFLFMYSSTAQLCISLLHCVPIGDQKVLFIDGTLKCYQLFQYFAFVYVAINIIPFCLVPVFGSYLLAFDAICLTEFWLGCLFPLPFCVKWAMLLFKRWRERTSQGYVAVSSEFEAVLGVESCNGDNVETPRSAVLQILLGPFRSHSSFLCFPESPIPWEGFLIFRRLIIILPFTFVYNVNIRMSLALATCVIILVLHVVVRPFKRPRDNAMETLSLSTLIILCGFTHVKAYYQGGYVETLNLYPLNVINIMETILIFIPLLASFFVIFYAILYVFLVWFSRFIEYY